MMRKVKIIAKEYALKAAELNPRGIISILAAANSLFTVGLFNEALVNYEKALAVAPHPPANVKLNYSMALLYLENYDKANDLATDLSENEQYFGGSQLGGLGIKTFIAMQREQKSEAKRLVEKMVEIDPDIKWSSLRRAMKTFIITDEKFSRN
jgi:tetratricopeptide (TPR) repeat protein